MMNSEKRADDTPGRGELVTPTKLAAENDMTMSKHDMKRQLYTLLPGRQSAY